MGISENADSPLLCSREIKLMQYSKDDIQKEILKAAEKVFLENGFPKASMREIAQEAQVGLSNIYNYFKSKDDIFCTVVRPVISAFERMLHEHHGRYGTYIGECTDKEMENIDIALMISLQLDGNMKTKNKTRSRIKSQLAPPYTTLKRL